MKIIFLSVILMYVFLPLNAQNTITLIEEDFESYTPNQPLASQSNVWETWSGTTGGTDDALVSGSVALSGSRSMHITHNRDMILPIGNYSSGHFIIDLNIYMEEEAYFNVMHECRDSWAFDLYMSSDNKIKYLDTMGIANSVEIDSYVNNQWVNFRFDIDIDLDTVITIIDNVERYRSKFSNAASGAMGSSLTCLNFFGLDLFNGVDNSNYYIDDILVTMEDVMGLSGDKSKSFYLFPNPANDILKIVTDEEVLNVTIYSSIGQIVHEAENSTEIDLIDLKDGVYFVHVETNKGTFTDKLLVN